MSTSEANRQRNWTSTEDTVSAKWFWMLILSGIVIAGVWLLFQFLMPRQYPRVLGLSISIGEYQRQMLPQPVYANWPLSDAIESFQSRGLVAWHWVDRAAPDSRNEFEGSLGSFGQKLEAASLAPRDSVIVYLRGHAIVLDGEPYLLVGDFDQAEILRRDEAKVSLKSIFQELRNLKAANVIVLADILDLTAVPMLGVMANHVSELLEQALNDESVANMEADNSLWVITSAAPFQPTHISRLKGRTLLQSACEFACDARRADDPQYLSLADFYESILRYSHQVTQGAQTPLLLRSGLKGQVLGMAKEAKSVWQSANDVWVAVLDGRADHSAQSQQNETTENPQTSGEVAASERGPGSVGRGASQAVNSQASAQPRAEEEIAKPDSDDPGQPLQEVLVEDPRLRFWQVREKLLRRSSPGNWSPVDFAVREVQQLESEAIRLERLHWFSSNDNQASFASMTRQLQQLALPPNLDGSLRAWTDPNRLPEPEKSKWVSVRERYRSYIDCMSQLEAWIETARQQASASPLVRDLVVTLNRLQSELPQTDDAFLFEYGLDRSSTIDRLVSRRDALTDDLERKVSELVARLTDPDTAINWSVERQLQTLLMDRNLSFRDRQTLTTAYQSLTIDQLEDPGALSQYLDEPDRELADLIDLEQDHLSALGDWCRTIRDVLPLASSQSPPSLPDADSPEALNGWGSQLVMHWSPDPVPQNPTQRWNRACLNGLGLFVKLDPKSDVALLRPINNDRTLDFRLSLPDGELQLTHASEQLPELPVEVRRRNGTLVDRCWIRFDSDFDAERFDLEKQVAVYAGSRSLKLRQATDVMVESDGLLALSFQLNVAPETIPSSGFYFDIRIADSEARLDASRPERVHVLPPKPDFQLEVECVAGSVEEISRRELKDRDGKLLASVLRALRVPAVSGPAQSRYQFYVTNQADENKTVVAKVFPALAPAKKIVGNGSIDPATVEVTIKAFRDGKLSPVLETDPTPLDRRARRAIRFKPAAGVEPPIAAGEFGLLCVLEEVLPDEDNSQIVKAPDPTFQWIDCIPEIGRELVSIQFMEESGLFLVESDPTRWSRYGVEELEVKAFLTAADGRFLQSDGEDKVVLTKDQPSNQLKLDPRESGGATVPSEFVAHFDIGGYPRARAITLTRTGRTLGNANQAFGWFQRDQQDLVFSDDQGKDVIVSELAAKPGSARPSRVVPARTGVSDQSRGEELKLRKLSSHISIDLPELGGQTAVLSLGHEVLAELDSDRKFYPRLQPQGEYLAFSATVSDISVDSDLNSLRDELRGEKIVEIRIAEALQPLDQVTLIFDRDPPERAAVELDGLDGRRLYLGQELNLSIQPEDGTRVAAVFFALDDPGGMKPGEYDEKDWLILEGNKLPNALRSGFSSDDGLWAKKLEANAIEGLKLALASGKEYSLSIVCRTIDIAGNFRDDHRPATFTWMGTERPVAKPPQQSDKQEEPANATPNFNLVYITVSVPGQARYDATAVQISGIPAESKTHLGGGKWACTNVPSGNYEVTAVYVDSRGMEYEGKVSVTVPGHGNIVLRLKSP